MRRAEEHFKKKDQNIEKTKEIKDYFEEKKQEKY